MADLKLAKSIAKKYAILFDAIRARLYGQDDDDKFKAACDKLKLMGKYRKELHATGYRNRDLDVDGPGRTKFLPITAAWRKKQNDRRKKILKSLNCIRKGDHEQFKKTEEDLQKHWYDNPDKKD